MHRSVNVVVAGAGYFAQFHINAWLRLAGVKLTAIVEADKTKHDDLKQRLADAGSADTLVTDSLSAACKGNPVTLIDIATPPHSHADLIEQAISLGIRFIVCQKPFCGTYTAALAIYKKIKASQCTVTVHENFRFQPWFREIKRQLNEGQPGTVLQATFRLRPGDGQGADAYLERQPYFRDMQNFLIHETGVHYIDVFRYLFGEPSALSADLRRLNPAIAGEDAGHFNFYYNSGLCAHFDGNRLLDHAAANTRLTMGEMLIEGTKGSLALYGNGDLLQRRKGDEEWQAISYKFDDTDFGGDCVYLTQKHIVEHLQHDTPLENTVGDYLQNLRLEELIYKAAATHTRLDAEHE